MKVKAKDIAKAAGVSTTAVSLVLNGKDSRISEATKEKILRISREMAFQSEITVQPGGSQRVKTLGLVLPDLNMRFKRDIWFFSVPAAMTRNAVVL